MAHGDQKSSRVVGRRVGELPVIPGATLAVIVRDFDTVEDIGYEGMFMHKRIGHVVIAHKSEVIQAADHVIVFCLNKRVVKKVEQLFQVSAGFL